MVPHVPHAQHQSVDVNMTSSAGHYEDVDDGGDADHAEASAEIVWKGLVALCGIYAFFITERLISLCRTARRRSKKVLSAYC